MPSVVFYGTGRNAVENLARWKSNGYEPLCFCDADIKKHNTQFMGYDVVSLCDVLRYYPDYELYLTAHPNNLEAITVDLLKFGISKDRVRFLDSEYKYGCDVLGRFVCVDHDGVSPCCNVKHRKAMPFGEPRITHSTVRDAITNFKARLLDTLNTAHAGITNDCSECPRYRFGIFPRNPKIDSINAGSGWKNTVCNFKCSYCAYNSIDSVLNTDLDCHDIHTILSESVGDTIKKVYISNGEITVLPHSEKVLTFVESKNWEAHIATNGLLYSQSIARLLKSGSVINVSLDAGERMSFHQIKNIDGFDRVIATLMKYSAVRSNCIILKYIMLPGLNDDLKNIDGFLKIAEQLNVLRVELSNNAWETEKIKNIPEQSFAMAAYFAARCKELNIPAIYLDSFFSPTDCQRMACLF